MLGRINLKENPRQHWFGTLGRLNSRSAGEKSPTDTKWISRRLATEVHNSERRRAMSPTSEQIRVNPSKSDSHFLLPLFHGSILPLHQPASTAQDVPQDGSDPQKTQCPRGSGRQDDLYPLRAATATGPCPWEMRHQIFLTSVDLGSHPSASFHFSQGQRPAVRHFSTIPAPLSALRQPLGSNQNAAAKTFDIPRLPPYFISLFDCNSCRVTPFQPHVNDDDAYPKVKSTGGIPPAANSTS